MSTGPIPADVMTELEALKLRLISMRPEDMPEAEAAAMAAQISAIRLQLKRLAADRAWVDEFASTLPDPEHLA